MSENGKYYMFYRYGNYTSDENKKIYIDYCFQDNNTLGNVLIGSYKAIFE